MQTHFIEASHGGTGNWGKFMLGRFTEEEWATHSALPEALDQRLLGGRGWAPFHLWVSDLQTGEGAIFRPGGLASADLEKHEIWVCPMFEPFLVWLYKQDLADLTKLPRYVEFPKAAFNLAGYRRKGKRLLEAEAQITELQAQVKELRSIVFPAAEQAIVA